MALTRLNNNSLLQTTAGDNFRNIIINGDMSIAQRGTIGTITGGGSTATVDRFQFDYGGNATITMSQDSDAPAYFNKSVKYTVDTGAVQQSNDYCYLLYRGIEGYDFNQIKYGTAQAKTMTLSFWVKASITGTYGIGLRGTISTFNYVTSYTINSANTWEKKTITINPATSGAFGSSNDKGLSFFFTLGTGSTFSTTANNAWTTYGSNTFGVTGEVNIAATTGATWQITGVQLEAGTIASDFEFLPVDVNLRRCMRYYEAVIANNVRGIAGIKGVATGVDVFFKERKRAIPTMSDVILRNGNSGGTATVSASLSNWTCEDYARYSTTATTGSVGDATHIYNANGKITADAEL